ncbi:hypothetical protein ACFX15_025646 [Malus domestica]
MNLAVRKRLTGSWDVRVDIPNASGDGRKQHRKNSAEEGHRRSSTSLFQAQGRHIHQNRTEWEWKFVQFYVFIEEEDAQKSDTLSNSI